MTQQTSYSATEMRRTPAHPEPKHQTEASRDGNRDRDHNPTMRGSIR